MLHDAPDNVTAVSAGEFSVDPLLLKLSGCSFLHYKIILAIYFAMVGSMGISPNDRSQNGCPALEFYNHPLLFHLLGKMPNS